jgi:predicted nucleic acid-binding protein
VTTDRPAAGILHTSVFIASKTTRQLQTALIPDEVATTVITLAELNAGVLAALTAQTRARRLRTLDAVADMAALPATRTQPNCGRCFAVHLAGTGARVRINDLWIAAIAASKHLPVVTQDDDFDVLDGVAGLSIIRV